MQEFESISASSYDPSALATKLTAKAADGWSVVAIVPTGGDVTAFVSREKTGADESPTPTEASEPAEAKVEEEASPLVVPANEEPAAVSVPDPEPEPDPKPEAVSEPSGWAIAPEPATSSTPSSPTPSPEPASSQPAVTVQPGASYQPTAQNYEPAPTPATPAAAATPEPAAAPAVPAGWYADPAGRFELRYWDGSTWTEHVSRSGQQFTDPPVA
jgi:hypothetical protein